MSVDTGHDIPPADDDGGQALDERPRQRIRIATTPKGAPTPAAIRVLTAALDGRVIPNTYVTNGRPVVIEAVSGAHAPTAGDESAPLPLAITELTPALLGHLLAQHTDVVRKVRIDGKAIEVETRPGPSALTDVLAPRSWPGLAPLHGIIGTPVLRPDGTLLQTPGYDDATGLFLAPTVPLRPVPERPTTEQVDAAHRFFLDEFLVDFPWRSDADRANYLALAATPILRPFTRALAPFGVIDATMPGSGKSILTGCVGLLVGQKVLTWTGGDDELRKTITGILAEPGGVVVFDNIEEGTAISSAVLARLVTERTWTDRRLGVNAAVSVPNDRLWLATGNNLRVGGDMASRTVWARLDPNMPHPEARTGFAIPNLDFWILDPANQAKVLFHLLVLILDWTSHGAPVSRSVPAMRQFTRWAQHLGGLLAHHGIPGFLANVAENRDLDTDAEEWRAFLHRWHELHGDAELTAAELRASAERAFDTPDRWEGTFPSRANGTPLNSKALGHRLVGQNGRWREDIVLHSVKRPGKHGRVYWVELAPTGTPDSGRTDDNEGGETDVPDMFEAV